MALRSNKINKLWIALAFLAVVSLLVFLALRVRESRRIEDLTRQYPDIPELELTRGSNSNQTTLEDGTVYFVNNGRRFYVKGVTTQVVFPDGREETRYLGTVMPLPQGQAVDLGKRQVILKQGDDQQTVTIPEGTSIQKQILLKGDKPTDIGFSPPSEATLEDIQVGDTVQLIEGERAYLVIIKIEQK